MKRVFLLLIILVATAYSVSVSARTECVVPQPTAVQCGQGEFEIGGKSCLVYDGAVRDAALYMLEYLPFKQILSSAKVMPGDVQLTINKLMDDEQYRLEVTKENIRITGGSYAGVFNGIQTLFQLLPPEVYKKSTKLPISVPCCVIEDSPKFGYRGFMLDVARTWIDAS